MKALTLAVCTHNRVNQLRELLLNLEKVLQSSSYQTEVLFVLNACNDDSQNLLNEFSDRIDMVVHSELELGLSNARNKVLKQMNSSAVWFIDDDILISQQALDAVHKAIAEKTQFAYFGGPIAVDWQGQKPAWLVGENLSLLSGLIGHYDLGKTDLIYQGTLPAPYGANFVLRKNLCDQVGWFDPELGVSGQDGGRGEERDYLARAKTLGFEGLYLAQMQVSHRFQVGRLNLAYLWRYGLQKGRAEVILHNKQSGAWRGVFIKQLVLGIGQLAKGRRDHFYQCWINMGIARGRYLASLESRAG